jgi:hypothetical protein
MKVEDQIQVRHRFGSGDRKLALTKLVVDLVQVVTEDCIRMPKGTYTLTLRRERAREQED